MLNFRQMRLDCYLHMQRLIEQGRMPNNPKLKKWFIKMASTMRDCSQCNLENVKFLR